MLLKILMLAAQLQTAPLGATVHQLRSWPWRYTDKEVVVCGTKLVSEHGRAALYDNGPFGWVAVMLSDQIKPTAEAKRICVRGHFGRVDGLSYQEGTRRYGAWTVADAVYDDVYWVN